MDLHKDVLVGVVGPCASGKSTLIANLNSVGVSARHIAQEHSYVQDMWQRITNPSILVFLDVSYPMSITRRNLDWTEKDYLEQRRRLEHARLHANLYIDTDPLTPMEVLRVVIAALRQE
jgi:ABC-type cobalamin/Fe3+-siderophores transport system ATPase subunit